MLSPSLSPQFVFVSERTFEPWDWTNPVKIGIGGSETSHIEMAARLARRAAVEVFSFAPMPADTFGESHQWHPGPGGAFWRMTEDFPAVDRHGWLTGRAPSRVWVIYRAPALVDQLPAGSIAWLICQDVDYRHPEFGLTEERALKFTRIVALCEAHAEYLRRRLPAAADRVVVSSNGIRAEVISEIATDPPERNLRRMMYASSPDRGLEYLLPIFERVRELVPDAELHVCYGFDNIDKVIDRGQAAGGNVAPVASLRSRLLAEMSRLGVKHYGRMGQAALTEEWFKSAVWCHPSNFTETSCITCMDAQACGAIPVTSPVWAIAENVQHGVFIEGDVRSETVRARYVHQVAELLLNPQIQAQHRGDMMPWALERFDWERVADQWEVWARHDIARRGRAPRPAAEELGVSA